MRGGLVRALGAACDAAPALRGAALGDSSRGFARSAGGAAAESDGKESSSGRGGGGEKSVRALRRAGAPLTVAPRCRVKNLILVCPTRLARSPTYW
jgi:hypothetical protein